MFARDQSYGQKQVGGAHMISNSDRGQVSFGQDDRMLYVSADVIQSIEKRVLEKVQSELENRISLMMNAKLAGLPTTRQRTQRQLTSSQPATDRLSLTLA